MPVHAFIRMQTTGQCIDGLDGDVKDDMQCKYPGDYCGSKSMQCPAPNLAKPGGGRARSVWLPSEFEGATTTVIKDAADNPVFEFKGTSTFKPFQLKLVTFDFDGTTELFDRLAHDVIGAAQTLMGGDSSDTVTDSNEDTVPCAAIPDNTYTKEDCDKLLELGGEKGKNCRSHKTVCMGTTKCEASDDCMKQITDNMIKAFDGDTVGCGGKNLTKTSCMKKYFEAGFHNLSPTDPDRWIKYRNALIALAEEAELWILSASWSPVPGKSWAGYLQYVWSKLGNSQTIPPRRIIGINDPGPGLAADKGAELKKICSSKEYRENRKGEKESKKWAAVYSAEECFHVDNGAKYAMQAAAQGSGGLHVRGAGVADLVQLTEWATTKVTTQPGLLEDAKATRYRLVPTLQAGDDTATPDGNNQNGG